MKITGTENSARMSFTASMPLEFIGQLNVGENKSRRVLTGLSDGLVASDRNPCNVVTEVSNDRFDVHRDDRLIFDDQHIGERLTLDLLERFSDQTVDIFGRRIDEKGRVL